jgi:parallel beta-helix repeat protein
MAWVVTLVAGFVFGAPAAHGASPVVIHPACGDTIGPGGSFILGADVGPCSNGVVPALSVDSAKLDLDGHTVSCSTVDPAAGILLIGQRAQLSHGTVVGCLNGVALAGAGRHIVKGIVSDANVVNGFWIQGVSRNKLSSNTASDNGNAGFNVQGVKNNLTGNTAWGNHVVGFNLYFADNAALAGNTATASTGDGGIYVLSSETVHLTRNTVSDNHASDGHAAGIVVSGGGNHTLSRNIVTNNDSSGIIIGNLTTPASISHNTATGNGDGVQRFDLEDSRQGCKWAISATRFVSNRWVGNTFNTANQTCIH